VRVTLENAGHYHESDQGLMLHDARRLRDFADRHDLLLTLDTSHAGTMAHSLITTYEILRERVVNIHLSDLLAPRSGPRWQVVETIFRHHQIPGRGVLPLAELVRLLQAQGYDGTCTLEMSPVALQAWSPTRMRRNLAEAIAFVRGPGPADSSFC
jgi:sugar phosphate isomerase/epimerase